ncbi:MAG: hypothetical protein WD872_01585 [Pirellulaceae bacterium]
MNEFLDSRVPGDSRIDRLVDGELSPDEYRSLLASLDDEPRGWRRCALAFLESQALGRDLAAIRHEQLIASQPTVQPAATAAQTDRPRVRQIRLAGLALSMAASLLMGFGLGVAAPWFATGLQAVSRQPPLPIVEREPQLPPPKLAIQRGPVERVRLVVDGPGGQRTEAGEVPVFDMGPDPIAWPPQNESPFPVELIEALASSGHHVERQQQLVPVALGDGRRGYIPVEGYQITPASRQTY